MKMTRRQALKTGAIGSAALLLPWGLKTRLAYGKASPALDHFVDPLPKPRVFSPSESNDTMDYYEVGMKQIKREVHSALGRVTKLWGYGDDEGYGSPGPTFEVRRDKLTTVKWINRLANDPTKRHYLKIDPSALGPNIHGATDNRKAVVHLHGGEIRAEVDGYPEDTFLPGEDETYDYDITQEAATLWYHDHAVGNTRLNVYMGLAGFFLVRDELDPGPFEDLLGPDSLDLPRGDYEIPIAIQDRRLKTTGRLSYDAKFDDSFFGDVALVNGIAWPYLDVEQRKYRFRVLNGSNSRSYTLQLGDGSTGFQQIGSDGGLLEAPVDLTELTLTPGERADIIIDFAQEDLVGVEELVLTNTHPSRPSEETDETPLTEIMQFRIQSGTAIDDDVEIPGTLRPPIEALTPDRPERYFKLEDEYDPDVGDSKWKINGLEFGDITEIIQNGTTEVWNFVNKSEMTHPMHLHLVQFQVLSRHRDMEGTLINLGVDDNEKGWKDTVRVGPKEIVRIIAKFEGKGKPEGADFELFPYHCHILEHEDHEMMRQYKLEYPPV
jgi:spore coat protein A